MEIGGSLEDRFVKEFINKVYNEGCKVDLEKFHGDFIVGDVDVLTNHPFPATGCDLKLEGHFHENPEIKHNLFVHLDFENDGYSVRIQEVVKLGEKNG